MCVRLWPACDGKVPRLFSIYNMIQYVLIFTMHYSLILIVLVLVLTYFVQCLHNALRIA